MRQGPNGRRPRGRPNRKQQSGPSRPNNYDSSGPEGRIRGNARQVYEKYVGLARDAVSAGEGIAAESYLQYAEHYFRIVNSSTDPESADRRPAGNEGNGRDPQGRQPNPREAGDHGQRGQEARGQEDDRGDAPPETSQPAPVEPQRGPDDRDGLDRVLGKDGTEVLGKDGTEPRPRARTRSRQRPDRGQEERSESPPQPDRSGNGEAKVEAARPQRKPDISSDSTPQPREDAKAAEKSAKDPDKEPVGA